MKVLFLCGGTGKRMLPLSEDKFLLKFLGKTLLEHQIEIARRAGLAEFVIVGNPGNINRIEQIVKRMRNASVALVVQNEPLGIANAIGDAHRHLHGEFIIVNPNDIFNVSAYSQLLEARKTQNKTAYLLAQEVSTYFPGGYLIADKNGSLKHIVEKPEPGKQPSNLVNLLVHLHTDPDRLVDAISKQPPGADDVYERAVTTIARDTNDVKVVPYNFEWIPIKYPWHILHAARYFLSVVKSRISPRASISPNATIDGKVIIAENARVLENAVIRGPAYIGRNTIIGNNCLVRDCSHIGDNCVIGFSTEIKNSYLSNSCQTHMNYIGDSVIGEGCSFGAGTITANWRLDEQNVHVRIGRRMVDTGMDKFGVVIGNNCRTGVNVGIMPGIKIGADSVIPPGEIVIKDIEPRTGVKDWLRQRGGKR